MVRAVTQISKGAKELNDPLTSVIVDIEVAKSLDLLRHDQPIVKGLIKMDEDLRHIRSKWDRPCCMTFDQLQANQHATQYGEAPFRSALDQHIHCRGSMRAVYAPDIPSKHH